MNEVDRVANQIKDDWIKKVGGNAEVCGAARRGQVDEFNAVVVCVLDTRVPGVFDRILDLRNYGTIRNPSKSKNAPILKDIELVPHFATSITGKRPRIWVKIVRPSEFGFKLFVETGPESLVNAVLKAWAELGNPLHDSDSEGMMDLDGAEVPTITEQEFFNAIGIAEILPKERGSVPVPMVVDAMKKASVHFE